MPLENVKVNHAFPSILKCTALHILYLMTHRFYKQVFIGHLLCAATFFVPMYHQFLWHMSMNY